MPKKALFLILIALPCLCVCASAAEDKLVNIDPEAAQVSVGPLLRFEPGAVILLPDGDEATLEEILPNGFFRTNLGQIITPAGVIEEGAGKGGTVTLDPAYVTRKAEALAKPDGSTPAARGEAEKAAIAVPAPKAPALRPVPEPKASPPMPPIGVVTPKTAIPAQPGAPKKPTAPVVPGANPKKAEKDPLLSLAQLLPMTPITPGEREPALAKEGKKSEKPATVGQEPGKMVPETQRSPKNRAAIQKPDKPAPTPQPEKYKKPAPGQPLRIPPDAGATGNLDFLEGCWQGIRPEYYSKRTVRECFCFGAGGRNGKRRIQDRAYNRRCIGATSARMGKNGVLSVTSDGAACTDGERWGAARMVCRNSGPRTPCSWVFTDANNGQQAYEIPFYRVESCGR